MFMHGNRTSILILFVSFHKKRPCSFLSQCLLISQLQMSWQLICVNSGQLLNMILFLFFPLSSCNMTNTWRLPLFLRFLHGCHDRLPCISRHHGIGASDRSFVGDRISWYNLGGDDLQHPLSLSQSLCIVVAVCGGWAVSVICTRHDIKMETERRYIISKTLESHLRNEKAVFLCMMLGVAYPWSAVMRSWGYINKMRKPWYS